MLRALDPQWLDDSDGTKGLLPVLLRPLLEGKVLGRAAAAQAARLLPAQLPRLQ